MVGTYTYDAYGKQITTTGGINNNFRYGGKYGYYYDEQVYGMYLAGARWYSPDLYRWMSRDPIEYAGGDNMFAYVAGNPVKYVDPSGLEVSNLDTKPYIVIPENGNPYILQPKGETLLSPDGIYDLETDSYIKIPGKQWLPDNDVCIENNNVVCKSGTCLILKPRKYKPDPGDPHWIIPDKLRGQIKRMQEANKE